MSGVRIGPNAKLTLLNGLAQIVIKGTLLIEGTLEVEQDATPEIVVGGNFLVGATGRFIPGHSTVVFNNYSQMSGSFYNITILEGAGVQTIGDVQIANNLLALSDLRIRSGDTLTLSNPDPYAFQGIGSTGGGTIRRAIQPGSIVPYRFESPVTFLQFYPTGTLPAEVSITTYPNTYPPGVIESLFVKRYYTISAIGGSGYQAFMSLRYDSAETPIPIDELGLFRDSSGVLYNMGKTDYLDSDRLTRAYDASILPAVCDVWLRAREAGALQKQQLAKAQQAEILTRALAQTGIVALIDEVTGFEKVRPQNALQAYLEMVIRKELAAWAKKFPDEFYENIYKLKGWAWPGMGKNRFSIVAHYTRDLVYERLGPGVLHELESKSPKNEKGYRPNKLHQWLTEDIGDPMLAQHLHALMMFQRLALANGYGWNKFLQMVDQVLPKRGTTLDLPFPAEPTEAIAPTALARLA